MVGEIVDFLQNLCPFLLIMLLIGSIIVVFVVVYIKLIIRSLELGMLSVVSPVERMTSFENGITADRRNRFLWKK